MYSDFDLQRNNTGMKKQMISNRCRLYLNDDQMTSAIKTLGSCRYIYNLYLDVWNTAYRYTGKGMSYYSCCNNMTELKKVLPWLREAESTALQSSLRNLSDAFNAYFDKRTEKPVFHKKVIRNPIPAAITVTVSVSLMITMYSFQSSVSSESEESEI